MKRCVIIGGAQINDYPAVRKYLQKDDFNIFCDSGQKHINGLGILPDLIVGDFDSSMPGGNSEIKLGLLNQELNYRNVQTDIEKPEDLLSWNGVSSENNTGKDNFRELDHPEVVVIPHEKFDTDTVYGVREGINRGYRNFLLIGVTGQRMYHTLGNLYILVMLDSMKLKGMIVDEYSDMIIVSDEPGYITDDYKSFSLLNITGTAQDIQIKDAKYCYLPGNEITCEYQYAVSNEVMPGKTAMVTVGNGRLLLIRDR